MLSEKIAPVLLEKLPTPSATAISVMKICQTDSVDINRLVDVVKTDVALSARMIAFANSAHFNHSAIQSVQEAVLRIGLNSTGNLALSFSLLDKFGHGKCKNFDYDSFWKSSIFMGLLTQKLGDRKVGLARADLFSLGLLARVGSLGLATAFPTQYSDAESLALSRMNVLEVERNCFHTDHLELSGWMIEKWGFDVDLVYAVSTFESPLHDDAIQHTRKVKLRNLLNATWLISQQLMKISLPTMQESAQFLAKLPYLDIEALEFHSYLILSIHELSEIQKSFEIETSRSVFVHETNESETCTQSGMKVPVLVVSEETTFRDHIQNVLDEHFEIVSLHSTGINNAIELFCEFNPRLIIIDLKSNRDQYFKLCSNIRKNPDGNSAFVLTLCEESLPDIAAIANESGVDFHYQGRFSDSMLTTFVKTALQRVSKREYQRLQNHDLFLVASELSRANRQLSDNALVDELTELPNRRAGITEIDRVLDDIPQVDRAITVMLVDVDDFKKVNDTFGHAVGDVALQKVARAILDATRVSDTVSRWGGEEFIVICPRLDIAKAVYLGQRICDNVRNTVIDIKGLKFSVTVSVGIATCSCNEKTREQLIDIADVAMYEAKRNGKNRVVAKDCS